MPLGAQEGEVEHLELSASVKVLELLDFFWLRNLGAHPLSLEHLEVGFEHLEFGLLSGSPGPPSSILPKKLHLDRT
jgi:hypothetical protein